MTDEWITCTDIVERRSGYGWTSGAGDRAGAYSALCGKPTVDGTKMCRRHLNRHRKMMVLLAAKRERDLAKMEAEATKEAPQ